MWFVQPSEEMFKVFYELILQYQMDPAILDKMHNDPGNYQRFTFHTSAYFLHIGACWRDLNAANVTVKKDSN